MNAWNSHPLRTEGNHSPLQLWTTGLITKELPSVENEPVLNEVINCNYADVHM